MPEKTPQDPGRNDPCHCGSGKKYKRCCLGKDEAAEREARSEAAAEAATASPQGPSETDSTPDAPQPQRPSHQPWKRTAQKHEPFQKFRMPRKRGGG